MDIEHKQEEQGEEGYADNVTYNNSSMKSFKIGHEAVNKKYNEERKETNDSKYGEDGIDAGVRNKFLCCFDLKSITNV